VPQDVRARASPPGPLRVVELLRVRLPLVEPFTSATATTVAKEALLVHAVTDAGEGWSECGAPATPHYTYETIDTARAVLRDHLVPRARAGAPWDDVRGHELAKAALATAMLDARLRADGESLARHLGGTRDRVPAGVVVGLAEDAARAAARFAEAGYRRVKVKIAPGAAGDRVRAARRAVGDGVALHADGNGAFALDDTGALAELAALDDCALECLEQPLAPDALLAHARLATRIRTPICLDETVTSARVAADALALGACRVVSVKPGRVGGITEAVRVHDECVAAGAGALVGGMVATGIGRAVDVALASLPGFTVTGDLSASDRFFREDLTEPFLLEGGTLRVPTGPGIGVTVRGDVVRRCTVARERL
jgi:O-succinylbenzoate synthase